MTGKLYIIAIEISLKTYEHLRYIRFDLDAGKEFCYRSRISYDYFAHGIKRRNRRSGEFLYYCDNESDMIQFNKLDPTVPMIDIPTIWDFYKLIGYNYKKQKWIKQ
jgi:hypothetical protein